MARNSKLKKPDLIKDIGRPSKFTKERCDAIVDAIAHHAPYELAAEANGICEATLFDWLNTAKVHKIAGIESDYTRFSESIKQAELNTVRRHTTTIAEKPDRWQADAWLLERRWPKHFGNNVLLKELNDRMNQIMANHKRTTEGDTDVS